METPPNLVVSGINYGENVGTGVTISGTVGAALEAASNGIPALAMSLETEKEHHMSYSRDIDFSTAAWFTRYFAKLILENHFPDDVDVLKVDVPKNATEQTPWQVTRVAQQRYYVPFLRDRRTWEEPGLVDYREEAFLDNQFEGTDVYVLRTQHQISVTPLSLDLTSRVDFKLLERILRDKKNAESKT
jgi:5'-nucleotidase